MKMYRYNCKDRSHRHFNNVGREKNPNAISFYAKTIEYADKYKYITDKHGDVIYECKLEEKELSPSIVLFDMNLNYKSLATYRNWIDAQIGKQMNDYCKYRDEAKTKRDIKLWNEQISLLSFREVELQSYLEMVEFQALSDFEIQHQLITELKSLGFDGYHTKKEIAIF